MSDSIRIPHLSLITLPVLLALVGGCAPDKGPGSLSVDYILGNSKTCAELGVERLRAVLYQGEADAPTLEIEEDVLCSSGGSISLEEVEPGLYSLSVTAYDAGDVAIFDNLGQPDAERRIEIFEAAEATNEAELTARPAELGIAWRLGDEGFGNCDGVGISRFEIAAFQTGGGSVLLETELDCELNGDAQGYRDIADPGRDLNGVLFGEAGIQALDASGEPVGDPALFEFEPVGPGYPVKLNIECTAVGCTGVE